MSDDDTVLDDRPVIGDAERPIRRPMGDPILAMTADELPDLQQPDDTDPQQPATDPTEEA